MFCTPPQDLVTAENPTHVLYSEKSVTAGQGLRSCHSPVNASRYIESSWSALPSDSVERAISHSQFYTLQHAKAFGIIGTYKLGWDALCLFLPDQIARVDSSPWLDGALRWGECSLWRCWSLQSARAGSGATPALQLAEVTRNSQKFPERGG